MKYLLLTLFLSVFYNAQAQIPYEIDVKSGSAKVKIINVKVKQQDQQLVLTGTVKRRSHNSQVHPGYINYRVENDHGEILQQGDTKYSPSLSLRRWKQGSKFSITLPNNLPQNSRIKLSWHKNT